MMLTKVTNMRNNRLRKLRDKNGAVIVLMAFLLFVLLGITAFTIDFGYRHIIRNELQNAADAAALAAARELSSIYLTDSSGEMTTVEAPPIVAIAQQAAQANYAGEVASVVVNASDVTIGDWDFECDPEVNDCLSPTLDQPDAVRVITRRDDNANGPITTFFAQIFNIDTLAVTAMATAALSGPNIAEPEIPIGISKYWFEENICLDIVAFSPSNDPASCAGWHTYGDSPSNDAKVREYLANFIKTGESGQTTNLNDDPEFAFIGGDLSKPTFEHTMVAFQKNGYDISGLDEDGLGIPITDTSGNPVVDATGYDQAIPLCTSTDKSIDVTRCDAPDSTGTRAYYPDDPTTTAVENTARNLHAWQTTVPVYDRDDCSNPNQAIKIIGFAIVEIQDVGGPSDKTVKGRVLCNIIEGGINRGGASDFGVKSGIPGLVE